MLDLERAIRFYTAVFGYSFEREEIHGNAMALFPLDENKALRDGAAAGFSPDPFARFLGYSATDNF